MAEGDVTDTGRPNEREKQTGTESSYLVGQVPYVTEMLGKGAALGR